MNGVIYGRLGQDAVIKEAGDYNVVKFSVGTNVYKKGGNLTQWVNASWFGKRAEALAEYLTKGSGVAVAGDLRVREYEKDGETKYSLDINVESVTLLGGGQKRDESEEEDETPVDEAEEMF